MSILYYSRHCENCRDFIYKLKNEGMDILFDEFFCTDNRRQLPPFLHSVPTIIVPDSDKPLVGDDAFAWLTFKLNQKYKRNELGTLDKGGDYVDLTQDPNEISLDSENYISINNIDKPIKPIQDSKYLNAESMDVNKRLEALQEQRSQFASSQKGQAPSQPNFSTM